MPRYAQLCLDKYLTRPNFSAKPYWCPKLKHVHAQARHFRYIWLQTGRPRGCDDQSCVENKSAKSFFRRQEGQCIKNNENNDLVNLIRLQTVTTGYVGNCYKNTKAITLKSAIHWSFRATVPMIQMLSMVCLDLIYA